MVESILPGFAHWSSMGGYAAFVWPAYAVAVAVLGGLAWHSWRAHRLSEESLHRSQRRGDQPSDRSRSR
jgi:heme exporter protein CcmD